jgi:hypothetical protein
MNLMPSKVGAEPKKVALLAGIVVIAIVVYLYNRNPSEGPEPATPRVATRAPATIPYGATARTERSSFRVAAGAQSGSHEFRPSLKNKIVDPSGIDPTLHLDLLAKLKSVNPDAGTRSLFEISAAPPAQVNPNGKEPPKILIAKRPVGPELPHPPPPVLEPKAPPIPLKFYGFIDKTKAGQKRAFFLDGDDILIAAEGDMVKKRYKILRIGVNSAVVEDTEFKSNNQQTLPLVAELAG